MMMKPCPGCGRQVAGRTQTTTTTVKYACMIVPRRGRRRSGARVQQYGLSHGTIEEAEEFVEQHPEVEWEIHHVATTTVRTRVR